MSTAPNKKVEALIARLASDKPDLKVLNEAILVLVLWLRRPSSRKTWHICVCLLDNTGNRAIRVFREEIKDGSNVLSSRELNIPTIRPELFDPLDGSIVVPNGFRWPWREVADGLARQLRAIPPRVRSPKPVRCPHCQRKFFL